MLAGPLLRMWDRFSTHVLPLPGTTIWMNAFADLTAPPHPTGRLLFVAHQLCFGDVDPRTVPMFLKK